MVGPPSNNWKNRLNTAANRRTWQSGQDGDLAGPDSTSSSPPDYRVRQMRCGVGLESRIVPGLGAGSNITSTDRGPSELS